MKRIILICMLLVVTPTQTIFKFLFNMENKREAIIDRVHVNAQRKFSQNIQRPFAVALVSETWLRVRFNGINNDIDKKKVKIGTNEVHASLQDLDGLVHQARRDVTRWRRWGISCAEGITKGLLSVIPIGIFYGAGYAAFATRNVTPVVVPGINKDVASMLGIMAALNNVVTDQNITKWAAATIATSVVIGAGVMYATNKELKRRAINDKLI